jgi:uncharacterized membrane protein YsdA (DUF1294 family)/cold shock CspA family protein
MRLTGILTDWKDDRGFGFVTPVGVGAKAFVHVSAFAAGARRPRVGDRLTYEVAIDARKGPQATRVQFADEAMPARASHLRVATVAALLFPAVLVAGLFANRVPAWLPFAVLVASAATFTLYALDKQFARDGKRRVPEAVLHGLALLGGWPGAAYAQQWLRHKSSKRAFQVAFRSTVALNLLGVAWCVSPGLRRALGFPF